MHDLPAVDASQAVHRPRESTRAAPLGGDYVRVCSMRKKAFAERIRALRSMTGAVQPRSGNGCPFDIVFPSRQSECPVACVARGRPPRADEDARKPWFHRRNISGNSA
ncbi:hypothetical protein [Lysobacter changpingensis]|uniref:hypothetical protein n=1 Tax=Lysobacter changpingensis TaxID=2792784 RepID=UPI001A8D1919|nr:hypothetical protein [Lysobacter changpingensis]